MFLFILGASCSTTTGLCVFLAATRPASQYSQEGWGARCHSTAGRYGRMCRQYWYELWKNEASQLDLFVLNPQPAAMC